MQDLSFLTRDGTRAPCSGSAESFFFFLINKYFFIYLFMSALGLCCTRAFSSCGERGLRFFAVHGLLIAVASLVVEHGL